MHKKKMEYTILSDCIFKTKIGVKFYAYHFRMRAFDYFIL